MRAAYHRIGIYASNELKGVRCGHATRGRRLGIKDKQRVAVVGVVDRREDHGLPGQDDGHQRGRFLAALSAIRRYETKLGQSLIRRVGAVRGARIYGITDPARATERCPTIAFTLEGHHPRDISRFLGDRGIYSWDGDYYAWELMLALGLAEHGGAVRVGMVHYNTSEEIERLGTALDELVGA